MLLGIGFGLLFLNTAIAIVVYFAPPAGWSILTSSIHALHSTGDWLNPATAWDHLTNAIMTGTTWAQTAAAAAIWILLPVAAGTARAAGHDLFMEPETKWYRVGNDEVGVKQFLVTDPDGYLIRFSASIGRRTASAEDVR